MSWWVWSAAPDAPQLGPLTNVPQSKLYRGDLRHHNWPAKAAIEAGESFVAQAPDASVHDGMPLVSERLRKPLESNGASLAAVVVRHARKKVGALHSVFAYGRINCISWGESEVSWKGKPFSGYLSSVSRFVPVLKNLDGHDQGLVHASYLPNVVLVRDDVIEQLRATEATGLHFVPFEAFSITFGAPAAAEHAAESKTLAAWKKKAALVAQQAVAEGAPEEMDGLEEDGIADFADDAWVHYGAHQFEGLNIELGEHDAEVGAAFRTEMERLLRARRSASARKK